LRAVARGSETTSKRIQHVSTPDRAIARLEKQLAKPINRGSAAGRIRTLDAPHLPLPPQPAGIAACAV
jgi:hypothetical protein